MNCDQSGAVSEHPPQSTAWCSTLIPGLPNDIALTILARLPRSVQACLRSVCRSWKRSMEPAAMSTIRKELQMHSEIWFVFSNAPDGSFEIVDPFSGCSCRICLPPQLCAERAHFLFTVCGVFGHEVLVSVEPCRGSQLYIFDVAGMKWNNVSAELQGLYSFDVAGMKWNDARISSFNPSEIRMVCAVDMEGGYVYAEAWSNAVKVLDLKTGMWEAELPDLFVRRRGYWGAMLQNCFCITGGWVEGSNDDISLSVPGEMWNPIDCTWTLLPKFETWVCEMCDFKCPLERQAVLKDQIYALRMEAHDSDVEVMCYEASSQRWMSLGGIPGSDSHSHFMLLGVGEELWVLNVPIHSSSNTMMIFATKPSLSKPMSWKILLKRPKVAHDFSKFVGEVLVT